MPAACVKPWRKPRKSLGLAPESAEARQFLNDAVEGMVKDAEDALTRGDLAAAKTQAQDARALVQQHSLPQAKLADVRTRIAKEEQRRDELQRQRQEQERQAEQKRAEEAALAARTNGLSPVTEQEREIEKLPPELESMREQAPAPHPCLNRHLDLHPRATNLWVFRPSRPARPRRSRSWQRPRRKRWRGQGTRSSFIPASTSPPGRLCGGNLGAQT